MRILIVAPNAAGIDALPELAVVASGNRPTILSGTVTRDQLDQALQARQYDVLHFIIHGNHGLLMLSDGAVTGEALARSCASQCSLRMVVLNACRSLGTAAQLHNALHAPVIAHEVDISDPAGSTFARELYKSLHAGASVRQAHFEARDTMLRLHHDAAAAPVMIDGDMVTSDTFQQMVDRLSALESDVREIRDKLEQRPDWPVLVIGMALLVVLVLNTIPQYLH